MLNMGEAWNFTSSAVATLTVLWAMYKQIFPYHLRVHLENYTYNLIGWVSPYVHVRFNEYSGERLKRSEAYDAIRNYLSANSTAKAQRLKASESKGTKSLVLSMDDHEEVKEEFNGVKIKWASSVTVSSNQSVSLYGRGSDERRFYRLTFHRRHRQLVTETYLQHVLREGRAIGVNNRERKLYTNNSSHDWFSWRESKWSNVAFEHPATFDTLAMDPERKEEIKKDLIKFSKGKEYYKKVGKPWKRGYLLYGPPGTGKSTMISAMANFLEYDVYDLELTTVKDNSELKRLLLDTKSKSIIVIEDIDCSLDLTGQRSKKKEEDEEDGEKDVVEKKIKKELRDEKYSKVTLSGLLNAIDGLWSACSGEKIMVFTTNFIDKLDPALIRRGRMDKHIEMSYCGFEAFKVLAKNYLDIESHDLYGEIKRLLEETDMSPADVAENLMPKSDDEDAETCLKCMVDALEEAKEKARKMAEEEEKKKAEEQEKKKKKKKAEEEEEKKKKKKKAEEEKLKDGESAEAKEAKENGEI